MDQKWGLYAGLVILLALTVLAAADFHKEKANSEPALSVNQAVTILAGEGIDLKRTVNSQGKLINGVKPAAFYINDSKHQLIIYCYDSINERITAQEMPLESDGVTCFFSDPITSAKNLMLIIIPGDQEELTVESLAELNNVSNAVLEKLNDTREIIFSGAGEYWESQTVVKYYEYLYYDESAALRYESYFTESTSLKYLGEDMELTRELYYEMQSPTGGSSGNLGRDCIEQGCILMLGSSRGNGAIPRPDHDITVTVRWNDQEETLAAKYHQI